MSLMALVTNHGIIWKLVIAEKRQRTAAVDETFLTMSSKSGG